MQNGRTGAVLGRSRITGPGAQAIKYDILTALLAMAASGDGVEARLSLRLSLLITARFNWRSGTFAVGQRELARMWSVTERTAKREMAEMRGRGWIVVAVPAARGRVAEYRIELDEVLRATMPHWQAVGPDFAARMAGAPEAEGQGAGNVVPLRRDAALPEPDGTAWPAAAVKLQLQDPAVYAAWLSGLVPVDTDAGILTLSAPSRFVAEYVATHFKTRLLAVLLAEDAGLRDLRIIGPGAV